jgi:hypothetical protein
MRGQDLTGSIAAGQDLAGRLCLAGARRCIYIAGPEVVPRITTTRGMVAGKLTGPRITPEFMNSRSQVRGATGGACWGMAGRGAMRGARPRSL